MVLSGFSTLAEEKEVWAKLLDWMLLAGLCIDLSIDIELYWSLFEPIWSIAEKLGLNWDPEVMEGVGGLEAPTPPKLEYRPLVVEDYFSLSYLLSQDIMLALLSRLLRDSSSFFLRASLKFFISRRSFSNFYLSMLSSLIWLYFSVSSLILS